MNYTGEHRAADIAADIALMELVRFALGEICYSDDPAEFRRRLQRAEESVINGITARRHFAQANDATENYIKESASAYVTRVISSIRHPADGAS